MMIEYKMFADQKKADVIRAQRALRNLENFIVNERSQKVVREDDRKTSTTKYHVNIRKDARW